MNSRFILLTVLKTSSTLSFKSNSFKETKEPYSATTAALKKAMLDFNLYTILNKW